MSNNIKAFQFYKAYIDRIYVDPSFQRRACWSTAQKRRFILSLNKKRVLSPIVASCANTGVVAPNSDAVSIDKYQKILNQNKSYVSLDGQNRSETIMELFNDTLYISGDFIDADDKIVGVSNKTFSQLPKRLQDALKDSEIEFKIMQYIPYSELNDIFLSINDGEPLNEQEKRNAINTPISTWARKEAESLSNMWPMIQGFKKKNILRFKDVEWLISSYMVTLKTYNFSCSSKDLDSFYRLGENQSFSSVKEYSSSRRTRFFHIMQIVDSLLKGAKKMPIHKDHVSQKIYWALLLFAEYLWDNQILNSIPNGISTTGYAKLSELVTTLNDKLAKASDKQFQNDLDDYDNGLIAIEPKKSSYYSHWQSDFKASSPRNKRKTALITEIINSTEYNSIISFEMITDEESSDEEEVA
tara:strand:+ start:1093 stop:2331 length:1239 start_codon:yes stop_codon:yes gene_type:complete